jgi:hypothetical protein
MPLVIEEGRGHFRGALAWCAREPGGDRRTLITANAQNAEATGG